MGRQIRKSKGKTMKPNFFVFCEGESEVAYISHLRSQYRAPIQIIPRKSDSNISVRYIENCKREYVATQNDKTFLMFDLDVNGMLEHLQSIPDVVLLVSNPCIELWYLLHFEECHAELTQNACIKKLLLDSLPIRDRSGIPFIIGLILWEGALRFLQERRQ